jgi:hypothetical protein
MSLGALTAAATLSFGATVAVATPPRYLARPVPVPSFQCNPNGPESFANVRATALADDGRVALVADCGSTIGGSMPFVAFPDGTVAECSRGTFTFASPAAFLSDGRVLIVGDTCPPVNGACVTAIAESRPFAAAPIVLGSSPIAASYVIDAQDSGWAVGWGPIVASDAWRVRTDGTLEALTVSGGSGLTPTAISPSGVVSGSVWVGNELRAVRCNANGASTVLGHLPGAYTSSAEAVGIDGSAFGTSGGQAAWWTASGTEPLALLPAGQPSVALAAAGHPAAANANGFAIFGSHADGTRLFRATGPLIAAPNWSDLGSVDTSAQVRSWSVVDAPRPNFLLASALTPLYQTVPFVWHQDDALRRLDRLIVNLPQASIGNGLEAVGANATGTILVNAGLPHAPYTLTRLAAGDVDGDGAVDGHDLGVVLSAWGPVPAGVRSAADFDGNQLVNGADLGELLTRWTGG